MLGIDIHALDEEPVQFSTQVGRKQQGYAALIDQVGADSFEAVLQFATPQAVS